MSASGPSGPLVFFCISRLFRNQLFQIKIFQEYYQCHKQFSPDLALHFVGPDLGPKCLLGLSADDKIITGKQRVLI